jgi:hypothetical protein
LVHYPAGAKRQPDWLNQSGWCDESVSTFYAFANQLVTDISVYGPVDFSVCAAGDDFPRGQGDMPSTHE